MTVEWPPVPQFPRLPPAGFDDRKVFAEYLRAIARWMDDAAREVIVPDSDDYAASSHTHAASDIASGELADARISESSVTRHEAAIDHDALTGFVAAEHIDWSVTGAEDVHVDRVPTARPYSTEAGITANAGGGQVSAYQLNNDFNHVDTVGSTNDSVKLLAAVDGLRQTVRNDGGNDLAVYPASGDAINALATDAAYALIPGGSVTFQAISAGQWFTF